MYQRKKRKKVWSPHSDILYRCVAICMKGINQGLITDSVCLEICKDSKDSRRFRWFGKDSKHLESFLISWIFQNLSNLFESSGRLNQWLCPERNKKSVKPAERLTTGVCDSYICIYIDIIISCIYFFFFLGRKINSNWIT